MPIFNQINIVAGDFDRSIEFYRRLGVSLAEPARTRDGSPFHANGETSTGLLFELDDANFARVWNPGWSASAGLKGRVVLSFRVGSREEVDRLYNELAQSGHLGLASPYDAFWGARYAIIEDPNGVAVGLMSPIDAARKTPPPAGWAD